MIYAAIVEQILGAVFGFQYLVDVIIGIFILIAFVIGVKRGIWRSLWRLIFVVGTVALVSTFALPTLATFVNTGFWEMTGMSVTMDVGGTEVVFTSVQQFIDGFAQYAETVGTLAAPFNDAGFRAAFALSLSQSIGWIVVLLATMLVSWLVSGFLWLILWGPLLKDLKKKKVKLLGGVLGLAQGYIYAMLLAISFGPLTSALAAIQNPTEAPYAFGTAIPLAADGLRPENSLLLSIVDTNNPFGMFSALATFEYDGTTYVLSEIFTDFIEATEIPMP